MRAVLGGRRPDQVVAAHHRGSHALAMRVAQFDMAVAKHPC